MIWLIIAVVPLRTALDAPSLVFFPLMGTCSLNQSPAMLSVAGTHQREKSGAIIASTGAISGLGTEMARIFIGVGSNLEREKHIRAGIRELRGVFHNLRISTIYENKAVGFTGTNFYNFVVGCDTGLDLDEVIRQIHRIEDEHGRDRSQPHFSSRTLDLDLLLYDDLVLRTESIKLPRPDIDKYAYVLCPLAEIAAELCHPVSGKTYARLWSEFDRSGQELWPVEFDPELEQ